LHYAKGVSRTRFFKNAQSKSWNIRYNRTLLYNQGLSIEHYKNIVGTKRHLVGKFVVLDKQNRIVYSLISENGNKGIPKSKGLPRCDNDRS
jgi:hypothetical protein